MEVLIREYSSCHEGELAGLAWWKFHSTDLSGRRATVDFRLVVQKLRREFMHAQKFPIQNSRPKCERMCGLSAQFLDNQLEITVA